MANFEIEVKTLLGDKNKVDELIAKMQKADPNFKSLSVHKQLNHYFSSGSLKDLIEKVAQVLSENKLAELKEISENAKDFSVRTADRDNKIILVVKASVDDTTSSNGTARREFETQVDLSLDALDKLVVGAGFQYQAKWSRERQEFAYKDLDVSVDKNAGYGYLAEFEKVIEDQSAADDTKKLIRQIMQDLDVTELAQDRLARMFDYYNKNWQDYYGTDKTFTIE